MLIVIPSASVGLGLPVQFQPQPTVGVRALGTHHFLLLGASISVDYFPGVDELRLTGLVRLGL